MCECKDHWRDCSRAAPLTLMVSAVSSLRHHELWSEPVALATLSNCSPRCVEPAGAHPASCIPAGGRCTDPAGASSSCCSDATHSVGATHSVAEAKKRRQKRRRGGGEAADAGDGVATLSKSDVARRCARRFTARWLVSAPHGVVEMRDIERAFEADVGRPVKDRIRSSLMLDCGVSWVIRRNGDMHAHGVALIPPRDKLWGVAVDCTTAAATAVASSAVDLSDDRDCGTTDAPSLAELEAYLIRGCKRALA